MKPLLLVLPFAFAALTSCGDMSGVSGGPPTNQGSSAYQGRAIQGGLAITRNGTPVSTIHTASPNVEQWKFVNGGASVVTKSRGNHGPATVEMFDTATGTQRDKVLAFAVKNGQPAWAAEYAE